MSENKLARDVCRIVGHDLLIGAANDPNEWVFAISGTCSRCGEEHTAKVKYTELEIRRYDVLDRAKKKILNDFEEGQAERKDL